MKNQQREYFPKAPSRSLKYFFVIFTLSVFTSLTLHGFELSVDSGLLMQPTSQYYHVTYGVSGETEIFKQKFIRFDFSQRPKFTAAGYEDQDSLGSLSLGLNLAKNLLHHFDLESYLGYGTASGYISEVSTGEKRSYSINGPILTAKISKKWKRLTLALSHQYFVGLSTPQETKANVAWPVSVTKFSVGVIF